MFMRQGRNERALVIWSVALASLEQMRSLADESRSRDTEQCCEIQREALEFSEEHK